MTRKTIDGDEVDAFDQKHHHHENWKPGVRKAIKTKANRRYRKQSRSDLRGYRS
ncbi:hypothetical protein [Nocardia sp. NPDC052566]|uniref:hypothetical protein n=1 Tax=Nocardia sp. NPDC052566 TaxID=3364330 RepID=UPI0037C8824F